MPYLDRDVISAILSWCDDFDLLKLKLVDRRFNGGVAAIKTKKTITSIFPDPVGLWVAAFRQKGSATANVDYIVNVLQVDLGIETAIAIGLLDEEFPFRSSLKFYNCIYDLEENEDDDHVKQGDLVCEFGTSIFRFNTLDVLNFLEAMADVPVIKKCMLTFEKMFSSQQRPYFYDAIENLEDFFWIPGEFILVRDRRSLLKEYPNVRSALKSYQADLGRL